MAEMVTCQRCGKVVHPLISIYRIACQECWKNVNPFRKMIILDFLIYIFIYSLIMGASILSGFFYASEFFAFLIFNIIAVIVSFKLKNNVMGLITIRRWNGKRSRIS